MIKAIGPKPALQLGLFALASAALLAGLHLMTRDAISHNETLRTAKLLAYVAPATDSAPLKTELIIDNNAQALWQIIDKDEVVAVVLPFTAKGGYSGDIELLVGLDNKLNINGVRVTHHRETPGLGDEIDTRRSEWIEVFKGNSLNNPAADQWKVKKDGGVFDQFTGATITPRAVVKSVKEALLFGQQHQTQLFSAAKQSSKKEIVNGVAGDADSE